MPASRSAVRQLKEDGFTVREIIERTGLHPVTVYRHLNDYNERRRKKLAAKRRSARVGSYECGVCGHRGHNARSHR